MQSKLYQIIPYLTILCLFLTGILGCKNNPDSTTNGSKPSVTNALSEETLYRPNYHFTPKSNWTNDPNGLFYLNGNFHLYFQYYPDSNKWGPMHWGHAISTDLMHWKEMPIALYPDSLGYIFSGSAVVDSNNSSGFGEKGKTPVVAIYAIHDPTKEKSNGTDVESQGIAWSLDEGVTWTKYNANPVIANPGVRDFRDPRVLWDTSRKQWVLVLAAGQKVMFYASDDLKEWKLLSDFGEGIGNHNGVWECPDLFPMKVEGTDDVKWVLLVSINPGGPNGGSATQYFIGDFDGKNFTVDPGLAANMNSDHTFWIDYGKDNYASVTWSDIPDSDGRRLMIGWMSNWQYASDVPTNAWRGAMTIPRKLTLTKAETYRLTSMPAKEIDEFSKIKFRQESMKITKEKQIIGSPEADLTRAEISFRISGFSNESFELKLTSPAGDSLLFGYDGSKKSYFVDRQNSGITEFSKEFASKRVYAPRLTTDKQLDARILLDKTSIELFYDHGTTVMTDIFFPHQPMNKLAISLEKGSLTFDEFQVNEFTLAQSK